MKLISVRDRRKLKQFIDFPHSLYEDDSNYVPELFIAQRDMLWPDRKHPFYSHSEMQLFLAYQDGQVVGRVAAIMNANHIAFTGRKEGFFGFFDSVNQQETTNILLGAVESWLKERGCTNMIGPVNLSTNDSCGMLVEGFDRPPVVMMPYNKPYYEQLMTGAGLRKKTDLRAYLVEHDSLNDRSVRLLDKLEGRLKGNGIVIRRINMKDFQNEIRKVREVYNKAWDKNLGFVPMTKEEFDYAAKDLKLILDSRFCVVAEQDDKLVGFALGLPDINQALIHVKRGRLLPTGIFKLLWHRRKIDALRVLMLGVVEGYRRMGIEACLYGKIIKNSYSTNIKRAECSWMLEDNYLMNHAIEQINGKFYKRYRLFEKEI